MNRTEINHAISSAAAVVYRTTQVPVDHTHIAALEEAMRVLRHELNGATYFGRRLELFYDSLRSCGILSIPPAKPKTSEAIMNDAKQLQVMLDAESEDAR